MKTELFRDFRRRLYHGCMSVINEPIKVYMVCWDIIRCCDHHFRRAIYGLGPHIMDYPEQSSAAGTVYGWCVTFVHLTPKFICTPTNYPSAAMLTPSTSTICQQNSECKNN